MRFVKIRDISTTPGRTRSIIASVSYHCVFTGNLRSGADALFNGLRGADPAGFSKARHYMLVIALFVAGAALGSALISSFGPKAFALAPAALLAVLAPLAGRRVRRVLRLLLRRPRHSADLPTCRDKTTTPGFS